MTTDNKTLADVQPGGRVVLRDQAERARFEAWAKRQGYNLEWRHEGYVQRSSQIAYHAWQAALSAQPSPGGQRDDSPMAKMAAALRGKAEAERAAFDQRVQSGEWGPMPDNPDVLELPPLPEEVDSVRCMIRGEKGFAEPCDYYFTSKQMRDYARTALAASQPSKQPDSVALGEATEFCIEKGDRQPAGEQREGDDFLAGICVALQCVTAQDCGVLWREIVVAVGIDDLLQYATFIEPEEWELAGFGKYASAELRRRKPRRKSSKQCKAPTAQAADLSQFRDALVWAEDAADCSSHPDHKAYRFAFTELLGMIDSQAVGNG